MPTLLEKLQKAKAAGVPDAEVKERLAELGIDPVADADLAYDAAKAAGAARKAAKDAKDADFARNSGYAPVVFKGVMGSPYLGRRPSPNPLKGTPVPKVEFADIPDEKVLSARAADHLTKDWLARKAFDKFVEAAPDAGEEFELPHVKVATALPKAYGAIKGISGSPVGSGKDDESLLGTLLAYGPKITPSGMGGTIIPTDASREMDKRLAAAMTEARAKGLPTLSPRVWKAAVEQEAQWKTRRLPEGTLAGAAQLAGNLGVDVAEAFVGLAELLNELGGITVVPKDQTLTQKMERGEKWGEAVGAGLVGGPIAVVAGMDKPFGESVWAEAPFSAWTMFADPAAQIAKFPKVQAATGRFAQVLTRKFLRDKAGLPNMPADILATIERVLVNGAKQADARATAILEQMMHNADAARAAIKNLAELIARQMAKAAKKGKRPQPVQPEVSPVDLAIVPRGDQSARKAAQADVGVARAAEAQAGVAAADMQAMADAVAPRSTETAMAKPEGLPHITDVRLDDALASIENIRNQAERLGDTDAYAKANDIHAALAAEKDRRKVAAERGDYGPTGDPVFDAAQAKVAEAVAKAEAAAQKTVSAELAAESAGVLPQVEAGTVWVPRDKVPGVAVPADQAFTIPNLQRNFGIGKTVATATMAIAKAVGVDTSKIRLTKGGTPGAGALEQKPRGVSLFSGGGLVEEGLRGIVDPIAAVEMDTRIAAHHGKAHGSTVINRDVRDVDFGQFDGIDHLHASPVCKSFSKAKANAAELPLDIETAKATARAIREAKPRYFTLENVPEYAKSEAVRLIVGELDKQGYKHDVAVYDSADYGAPTHRKRLLLRAWREGEAPPPKATPTHGPKAGTPYADWFSTIEDLLPSQEPSALAPWQVQRLAGKGLKQGEAYLVMGGSSHADAIPFAKSGSPAPTIKATPKEPIRVIMPDGTVKKLGPRAIARLQGLPDTYPLPDRTATARVIIGNGVPPPLAKAVFGPMLEAIATPDVLYQSARRPDISPLGLFDNIGRAMDGWQPRGTPEQLKAYLAKVHGAAQEAADIGLDQWLADKQTITREQVRKFVEDHEVKVEEAYGVNRYKRYTEPGGSNYQELLLTAKPLAGNDFRSRHFPELKNIIAHLRVKDRTLPDGRKVLFAEEVQSDWQQLARKKGVVGQDYVDAVRAETQAKVKLDAAKAELAELAAQERESGIAHSKALRAVRAAGGDVDAFIGSPEEMRLLDENTRHYRAWEAKEREVSALDYERIEAWRKVDYLHGDRAASPPLRNAGWKRLAIKRLLAYAAEHGYDAIAWTTGETQAKRYDLEHLVDALAWKHIKKDNRFDLWVEPKGGGEQTFVGWFTPDELEAQIGKDAASNIVRAAEAGEVSGELRGPDLAVGGHGMRGFYDRELKNLANDIAKQYGQKVGVGKVSTGVELAGPYFDSYSEKWVVETLGEDVGYMDFVSREEAAKWAAENQGKIDAHILPVPEAMRAKINAEGLPLYQPAKGAVEFLADGTALIRALKSPDASTGVHELAHVARRQVLNEAGGFTPDEIAQAEAWAGAKGGVWDTAAEEKFARGFERYLRDGTAPTKALAKVFAKFKDWLTKVYATLTGSAIDINISPEMRSIFDKMVQRGEKLGDAAPEAPTRMVARDDRSGMIGQRGDLHDLLPEVPKSRRQSIEDAARQAGLAGRDAFAAGFDPNKPAEWIAEPSALSDDDMDAIGALLDAGDDAGAEALEKSLTAARAAKAKAKAADQFSAWKQANRLPDDASVYQVGRTIADYLFGRNVTDPQVLSSMLKEIGVPERAANAAATFLWAEAETRARAKMVEPSYGGIRRPTPEVTRWSVAKDGSLVEMPEARSLDVARDATLSGPGAARQGRNYLHEMASRQLVPEAPKPVTTDNPVINGAIAKVAEVIKSAYYTDDLAPTDARAMGPVADATGMPTPQQWVQQANQGLKELTQERIAQRVLEAFDADTTQTLRSAKIRNALLDLARSRLRDAGVSGAAARKALVGILKELESPDRVGALSKSRFPEVYANGKPIITRADFSTVNAKAAPKIIGEVIKSIADDMAEATFGYHTLRDMSAEVYRFMTTPEGNVDANVVGSATRYAAKMADRVLRDGEIHPTMMPYSGEKVASALRTLAADGGLSHLPTDKVLALADFVERFRPASETGGLADQIGSWMSNLYRSTQPPPKMHNVHIEPNALASLRGHFGMLTSAEAPGVLGLVRAIGQHTKKAVVALNFPSLVNNDLANLIVQGFRRADPMQPVKALKVAVAYKAYRDGKYGLLDPRTIRIFKALDQTDMFNQSDIAADIGRTEVWRQLEATIPQTATARRKLSVGTHGMSEVPGRVLDSVNDALAEAYTKLGDSPFRLEEAVNAYNAFESKVLLLKEGEWLDLATGDARTTRIERTPTGFAVVDLSAPHAKRRVTLGESVQSPQLTQALADAANVAQERPFFNYSRIGNMGKYLRGGPFSLLSGIFSWFFKSVDVPGLKRGMMSEIMSHPYQVKTNSAAVLSEQAANNRAMALRRSMAVSMARAALGPQRDREELRRAMGWNAAEVGTVLRAASNPMDIDNPTHLWTRNVNPVVSVAPSAVVWGLGQYLASKAAFGDILDDPATLAKTLRPDDELTPSQLQSKRLLLKMARSETFSPKQGFQLLGLGGGPLLTLMERLKNSGQRGQHISGHEAIYEFSKLMFGATPVKAVDVGLGAAGSPWSTYGKDFAKQGFHGGQPPDDASGFARWALRQLVGAGYQRVAIEDGENVETGGTLHGKLRNYLQQAKTTAKATLLAEAKRRANLAGQALSASPSDKVLIKAREDAIGLVNTLGDVIDTEFDAYKQRLDDQFRSLGPAEKRWLDNRR